MKTSKLILALSLLVSCLSAYSSYAQELKELKELKEIKNAGYSQVSYSNHDSDEDDQDERTLPPMQYKFPSSAQVKKVVIKDLLGRIKIVGNQSNEIVIDAKGIEALPARAKGLKPLYGNGCMDNTGTGVAANESGGVLTICGASKGSEEATYIFNLPKGVSVSIDYGSPFANEDIEIKEMESEVEVSTLNGDIKCQNVTGPLVLNSISGNVEITISKLNQNSPSSISLISGDLDLTIPVNSAADLTMSTLDGGVYTDFEIKTESKDKELSHIGGRNTNTKLNGGGVDLNLSCLSGNIYLRKK